MTDLSDLRRAAAEGCAESRLLITRRAMLGVTAGLFSAAFLPGSAMADSGDARLLIVVLRGGMDGLSVVPPIGDPDYQRLRRDIALSAADTVPLDGTFGLHPAMPGFGKLFRAGQAAVVHATCVPLRTRSHFDCQDNLENGLPGSGAGSSTGWLNRLLAALPKGNPVAQQGAIQVGGAPLILRGPAPVLGWSPTWFTSAGPDLQKPILRLYKEADQPLFAALRAGLTANARANEASNGRGASLSTLRRGFRGAGALLAQPEGPRIAVLSVDGWDTHSRQGAADGILADRLAELDAALADFRRAVGEAWRNTVVICATEFGRTAEVNGSGGTDHGVGTVTLLAGGAVAGGKVYGDWPGLGATMLHEGRDLRATTDLRAVFKGVLEAHLGVPERMLAATVFPESAALAKFTSVISGNTQTPNENYVTKGNQHYRNSRRTAIAKYRNAR